jgi:hypothetical protein
LVAFVALACACGHRAGSPRLEGRWKGVRAEGVPPDTQAVANAFAVDTELEINGDTIAVATRRGGRQSGRFKVVKEGKATVVITTDRDGLDDPQTFTFVDDVTMKWAVFDGKSARSPAACERGCLIVFAKQ